MSEINYKKMVQESLVLNTQSNTQHSQSYQEQYAAILSRLISSPRKVGESRIGDIHSNFCEQIRVDLTKEFPLMDIKNVKFSNILHELLWFIKGDTNVKYLIENDCHIWTDDAYRYYKEKYSQFNVDSNGQYSLEMEISKEVFVEKILAQEKVYHEKGTYTYGDLDRVYGRQWRDFNGETDQLQNCIDTLRKNPSDRRMIVVAHNPTDLENKVVGLPSCHNYFQFYTEPILDEKRLEMAKELFGDNVKIEMLDQIGIPKYYLSVFFNIRSNDWFLGQPYNMPSYALIAMMVGRIVNMIPKELVMNAVDAHLYKAHFDAANEWLTRYYKILDENGIGLPDSEKTISDVTFCKCGVEFTKSAPKSIDDFNFDDFNLVNYEPQKYIKAQLLT